MIMGVRIFGAIMILSGCTGIGFSAASFCGIKVKVIQDFLHLLDHMMIELSCRVTPLPELCQLVSGNSGMFCNAIRSFAESLETQIAPDPETCMAYIITQTNIPCQEFAACLNDLSCALGCYDLQGQLRQLEMIRSKWNKNMEQMENDLSMRMRSFRVSGVCVGCALAILLV